MLAAVMGNGSTMTKQFAVKGTGLIFILALILYLTFYSSLLALHPSQFPQTIQFTSAIPPSPTPAASAEPPPPSECSPPPSPYDRTKVAFLVETRPLPHLPALFAHMTSLIPPEWTFRFMGSPTSIAFMRSSPIISRLEASGKLTIIPLPSTYSVSSREYISRMFTDPHLYRDILAPAEHLLVFQPDSIFCANAPVTLNDFLEWDWIGAPWSKTAKYGGNGGLSLRKVSRILEVLERERRPEWDGALEDLWLTDRLHGLPGARIPNAAVSKKFSVESVWDETPLGYHIGWLGVHHEQIWDDQGQVDHIMEYCPEVKMILGMKLAGDKPNGVAR